jgi:hypothetical protein
MDTPVRSVRGVTGWPARGLRRLYHILMGAPELEKAKPRSVAGGLRRAHRDPDRGGSLGVMASVF